jgi:hypothetical protein
MADKVYLGDTIYAETIDYGIRLTTEDGILTTNEVYLDADGIRRLLVYIKFFQAKQPKEKLLNRLWRHEPIQFWIELGLLVIALLVLYGWFLRDR